MKKFIFTIVVAAMLLVPMNADAGRRARRVEKAPQEGTMQTVKRPRLIGRILFGPTMRVFVPKK